jgi:YVTN family beta-propeller protein
VVYRAYDERLKRRVALKLIAPELSGDEGFRARFLAETELAAALEHPHVVPVYDAGEVEGQLYLAMRFVEGADLKRVLGEQGWLEPARALALLAQVAGALDAAHARGLVHRDVKPSNVLLDGQEHVYLTDFGLSRRLAEPGAAGAQRLSLGTPAYAAPEQIAGAEADGRADLYSLGCLLYECLAGRPPFPRESELAVLWAHLEDDPPTPPDQPELAPVLAKALAKDPAERYGSGAELIAAASQALGVAAPVRRRRSRWPLLIALGLVLVAAAPLAYFLTRSAEVPETAPGLLVRIDPKTNRPAQTIRLGAPLSAVAAGAGGVWAASVRDDALWRIDPRSLAATRIASVGAPYDLAVEGDTAYAVAEGPRFGSGNVTAYGAGDGHTIDGVEVGALRITAGADGVWAAASHDVERLSPAAPLRSLGTLTIPTRVPLDAAHDRQQLNDLVLSEGSLWVIGDAQDRRLWRLDPRSRRIVATIELPFAPAHLAAGAGSVWVTDQLGDAVARIDPATKRIVATIPVGRGAGGIAFGAGSVWATSFIDDTVSRIDPATNAVVATVKVGGSPRDVAVAAGSVWAAADAG